MKKLDLIAIAAFSSFSLVACAGTGNPPLNKGERISQRGDEIGQYGAAWSAGREDVVRGERLIARSDEAIDRAQSQIADAREAQEEAEDRLREARQDKEDAERLVSEGNEQMARAEENYEALRASPSADN